MTLQIFKISSYIQSFSILENDLPNINSHIIVSFYLIVAKTSTYRQIQWNYNWIDLGIVTTSKLELKLLPDVKSKLWHSVRGNFKNLNLNVLNYRFESVFRMWQVSFTSQVFPSSYKQLSKSARKYIISDPDSQFVANRNESRERLK